MPLAIKRGFFIKAADVVYKGSDPVIENKKTSP
jgi:hypothetical protein